MLKQETAETVALQALAWFAADGERLGHFLGATGASPDSLRDRAQDHDFLVSVLDFLLMDDETVVAFCEAEGLPLSLPAEARAALPGGDIPHWT